ncbi:MAG TPA: permease-like cell division protein FtsX [Myxococcota bacterium]|jgi:cell division transport system permease protein|nr:permease-like cell division protein FtsX [Myxococcota bacterium]
MAIAGSPIVQLRHFARSALAGLRASPLPAAIATLTIAVTLVLAGAFALLVRNMQGVIDRLGSEARITAYLAPGASDEALRSLVGQARALPGVAAVELVSPERARERFRKEGERQAALLDALGENPLPASIEVSVLPDHRSATAIASVAESLQGLAGVDEVSRAQDWVEGYARTVALLRAIGIGLAGVLGAATLFLVASTIRLALYTRRGEIDILALVGAGRAFIALPFLLEGVIEGLIGGVLAVATLFALWSAFLPSIAGGLELLLGGAPARFLLPAELGALVIAGVVLGGLGAALSLAGGWRR